MKNCELLDMIGEVNEDYVLAADGNVVRPRFRWKALAACAACVALIVAAYPAFRPLPPQEANCFVAEADEALPLEDTSGPNSSLIQSPGLHPYTLVEKGGQIMTTQVEAKISAGDIEGPIPEPAQPPRDNGPDLPGGGYVSGNASIGTPANDASIQEEASAQYDRLLQGLGLWGIDGRGLYPDWCGGIWLDGEHLTVAIVDGFRSPALEAQILGWCGGTGEVLFTGVKYSQNYLDGLMDEITRVFDELDCHISSAYGVYLMDNYLGLDFFGAVPGDDVLAALAGLDPEGDAIRIQVFPDGRIAWTDEIVKGPASEPVPTPAPADTREEPAVDDLPQAKYDAILGTDG